MKKNPFIMAGVAFVSVGLVVTGIALWLNSVVTFLTPSTLFWLAVVPIGAALAFIRQGLRERATQRLRKGGDRSGLGNLVVGRSPVLSLVRTALFLSALFFLIIALARPQYGSRSVMLHKRGIDVVIALDFSKSMLAQDVRPDRIRRSKAELLRLIDDLSGDRVGIVAFAGETLEFPMTLDYNAIRLFLRDLGPYDMPVGGTAIGRALMASKGLLERSNPRTRAEIETGAPQERSQVVILITDGEDHEGDPVVAAEDLAESGIKVFTIGIGSATGEPIPTYADDGTWTGYLRDENQEPVTTSLTPENEAVLQRVAEVTGGSYIHARRGDVGVQEIREAMRQMKQAEQETRRVTVHEDRFVLALLPAFLLLLLQGLLPQSLLGRRRRAPLPLPRSKKSLGKSQVNKEAA